jgi:hypothetical protein
MEVRICQIKTEQDQLVKVHVLDAVKVIALMETKATIKDHGVVWD